MCVLTSISGCAAASAAAIATASTDVTHASSAAPVLASVPVPGSTARRLPHGVFYLFAGPPQASAWASVWQISSGREQIVTKGAVGHWIRGFAASPRGVFVSAFLAPYDMLARWTRTGPVWLHPNGRPNLLINGFVGDISPDGTIAYQMGGADSDILARSSWKRPDRIVRRYPNYSGGVVAAFGPHRELALIGPYWTNLHGRPDVLVLARDGRGPVIRRLRSGFTQLGYNSFWGPGAPAMVAGSSADTFELLFPSGRREMLPKGWRPLAWDPAGRRILLFGHRSLGIWSLAHPHRVTVIGPVSRGYDVFQAEWLASPAGGI
jgi:hypothetical protein